MLNIDDEFKVNSIRDSVPIQSFSAQLAHENPLKPADHANPDPVLDDYANLG